jgi:large subunit ribosomal protein L4
LPICPGIRVPLKTRAGKALAKWGATRPTLVVLDAEEIGALKSFRNIDRVSVAEAGAIGVADVIGAASLVISETALDKLKERVG